MKDLHQLPSKYIKAYNARVKDFEKQFNWNTKKKAFRLFDYVFSIIIEKIGVWVRRKLWNSSGLMLANANVVYKKLAAIIIVLSDFNQLYTLIF